MSFFKIRKAPSSSTLTKGTGVFLRRNVVRLHENGWKCYVNGWKGILIGRKAFLIGRKTILNGRKPSVNGRKPISKFEGVALIDFLIYAQKDRPSKEGLSIG